MRDPPIMSSNSATNFLRIGILRPIPEILRCQAIRHSELEMKIIPMLKGYTKTAHVRCLPLSVVCCTDPALQILDHKSADRQNRSNLREAAYHTGYALAVTCLNASPLAIDTGGTFTDCVYRVAGQPAGAQAALLYAQTIPAVRFLPPSNKLPGSLRADRSGAALEIRNGTTVATNALLERKGARVAFVTTAGFEDTLAIARQARPSLYDWTTTRPLLPSALRQIVALEFPSVSALMALVLLAPTQRSSRNCAAKSNPPKANPSPSRCSFPLPTPHTSAPLPSHLHHSVFPSRSRTKSFLSSASTSVPPPLLSTPTSRRTCRVTSWVSSGTSHAAKLSSASCTIPGGILLQKSRHREPVRT